MKQKIDLSEDWIQKAEHDLGMAELALENKPDYTDSIEITKQVKDFIVNKISACQEQQDQTELPND